MFGVELCPRGWSENRSTKLHVHMYCVASRAIVIDFTPNSHWRLCGSTPHVPGGAMSKRGAAARSASVLKVRKGCVHRDGHTGKTSKLLLVFLKKIGTLWSHEVQALLTDLLAPPVEPLIPHSTSRK
jgi:hypothetical protein